MWLHRRFMTRPNEDDPCYYSDVIQDIHKDEAQQRARYELEKQKKTEKVQSESKNEEHCLKGDKE